METLDLFSLISKIDGAQVKYGNRIMIVDDEEFCLMGLKVILESMGFDVRNKLDICISASEAIEKV